MPIRLNVNGEQRDAEPATTVSGLLEAMGASGRRVAVMVNDTIVPRHRHETTQLSDGDRVEVLSLVAGG